MGGGAADACAGGWVLMLIVGMVVVGCWGCCCWVLVLVFVGVCWLGGDVDSWNAGGWMLECSCCAVAGC